MLSNFLFLQLPSSHLPLYLRRYFELRPLRCSFIQSFAVHVVYCVSIFRFSKSSSSFSFPSRYLGIDPDLDFKGNLLSILLDIYSFPPSPPNHFLHCSLSIIHPALLIYGLRCFRLLFPVVSSVVLVVFLAFRSSVAVLEQYWLRSYLSVHFSVCVSIQ